MHKADNLPPSCVIMKSGNLNFLEPSGPLQACDGTALPFLHVVILTQVTIICNRLDGLPFLNNFFLVFSPSVIRMCLFWVNPLDDIVVFTA